MGTGNKCVVCLTKYGLASIGFTAVIILLVYLMITTPWRAVIAVVIPTAVGITATITNKIRPRDCAAVIIMYVGYFNAAMAYIWLYIKAGTPAAYFYYAMFMATTLLYIAIEASITC